MQLNIYIFVFLISIINLSAQSFVVNRYSLLEGNRIELDLLPYNENGGFQPINTNQFELKLNNDIIVDYNLELINNNPISNLSLLIALDISQSMQGERIANSKQAISDLCKYFDWDNNQVALTNFNHKNYLLRDYTSDKARIEDILPTIDARGGSNFNAAYFTPFAGAFLINERANFNKNIVLITDGNAEANIDSVMYYAMRSGAKVHTISFGKVPDICKEVSLATNGLIIDYIKPSDLSNALNSIYLYSKGSNYYRLTFESNSCNEIQNLEITSSSHSFGKELFFQRHDNDNISIEPSNYIQFGFLQVGQTAKSNLTLKSINGIKKIKAIVSNCNKFNIIGNILNQNFSPNNPLAFEVQYTALDTNYTYCTIDVYFDDCSKETIYLNGGSIHQNRNLSITSPKANDYFHGGAIGEITWRGILPNQSIKIDFSPNMGELWQTIFDDVNGNKVGWQIPDINSNLCLLRAYSLSEDSRYEDVIYKNVNGNRKLQAGLVWTNDNSKVVAGTDDGRIVVFDVESDDIKLIGNSLGRFSHIFGGSNTSFISSISDAQIALNKILNWDTNEEEPPFHYSYLVSQIRDVTRSPDANNIAAAMADGSVIFWNANIKESEPNDKLTIHGSSINTIDWSNHNQRSWIGIGDSIGRLSIINFANKTIHVINSFFSAVTKVKFVPNSHRIAALSDGEFHIYNLLLDGFNIVGDKVHTLQARNGRAISIDFTSDGKYLILLTTTRIEVYNADNYNFLFEFDGHSSAPTFIKTSTNSLVASYSHIDNEIIIWNPALHPFRKKIKEQFQMTSPFTIARNPLTGEDVNFGNHCVGFPYDTTIVGMLTNTSQIPIIIDSAKVLNNFPGEFFVLNSFPITIPAGGKHDITYNYNPRVPGPKLEWVNFYSGTKYFSFSLNAAARGIRLILENDYIDFGSRIEKEEAIIDTITFRNTSGSRLNIVDYEILYGGENFKVLTEFPITVPANSTYNLRFSFTPDSSDRYSSLIKFNTETDCTPLELLLAGEGRSTKMLSPPGIYFDTTYCSDEISSKQFEIKNIGSNPFTITSIETQQPFEVIGNTNNIRLESGEVLSLEVRFKSANYGYSVGTIDINTLEPVSNLNKHIIPLSAFKDTVKISSSSQVVQWEYIGDEVPEAKSFKLYNHTKREIDFTISNNSPKFSVISISPNPILPFDSTEIVVEFAGGQKNELFIDALTIEITNCQQNKQVNLIANLGVNDAKSELEIIDTPLIAECGKLNTDLELIIRNIGTSPLILENLTGSLDFTNYFEIATPINGLTLLPNTESKIVFKQIRDFLNKNYSFVVEFLSNDVVFPDGKINIQVPIENRFSKIVFDPNLLNLGQIDRFFSQDYSIKANQIGNQTANATLHFATSNITLDESSFLINENESVTINFNFTNDLNLDNAYFVLEHQCGLDTFVVTFTKSLEKILFLKFNQNAISETNQQVNLPLTLSNPIQFEIPTQSVLTLNVSTNGNVLSPINFSNDTYIGGIRHTQFDFPIDNALSSQIAINYLVALGDEENVILKIDSAKVSGDEEINVVIENDGQVDISNICKEVNERLIASTGQFYFDGPNPNPVIREATLNFYLIENGKLEITIADVYGNTTKSIRFDDAVVGQSSLVIDLSDLNNGLYFMTIKTATIQATNKFLKVSE